MSLELPKSGIYMIRNAISGKVYIGSAMNLERRQREHFNMLRRGAHHSRRLQNSFDKHGERAFSFAVLARCTEPESLTRVEQRFIDFHRAAGPNGYNSRPKADSNLGHKFSAETVEKNRRAQTGKKQSAETIEKRFASMRGRPLTEEHKKKLGDSKRGRSRPDVIKWAPEKFSKFSADVVAQIRADRASGSRLIDICEKYGCSMATASYVSRGIGAFYSKV